MPVVDDVDEDNRLGAVEITALPETIGLVVERDDVEVLSQSFTVEPDVSYPNGPECEPACRTWSGTADAW